MRTVFHTDGGWRFRLMTEEQLTGAGFGYQTRLGLFMHRPGRNGSSEVAFPDGHFEEVGEGDVIPVEALWRFPVEAGQGLMDFLWNEGVRPAERRHEEENSLLSESRDHERKMYEGHINDLRCLLFSKV